IPGYTLAYIVDEDALYYFDPTSVAAASPGAVIVPRDVTPQPPAVGWFSSGAEDRGRSSVRRCPTSCSHRGAFRTSRRPAGRTSTRPSPWRLPRPLPTATTRPIPPPSRSCPGRTPRRLRPGTASASWG